MCVISRFSRKLRGGGGALVRHQQDWEAKLLICRLICVGTLTYGRELWAVTVKKRLQNASGRNDFLPQGGSGPFPRGRLSRFQGHVSIAGDPGGGRGNRRRDYKSNLDLGDLRVPPHEDLKVFSGGREAIRAVMSVKSLNCAELHSTGSLDAPSLFFLA